MKEPAPPPSPQPLTHVDESGAARMVDVGDKDITRRSATARAFIWVSPEAHDALSRDRLKKGDAIGTARIAGIQAVKRTADLIPLCHPLRIVGITLDIETWDGTELIAVRDAGGAAGTHRAPPPEALGPDGRVPLAVTCTVDARDRTGVEMEALTGATVAALTLYDMMKAVDREMVIGEVRVLAKSGGKSGDWGLAQPYPGSV